MGMTVRLTDGRLTVTVEGVRERLAVPAIPPVAELPSGPDLLLIAQWVKRAKARAVELNCPDIIHDCDLIQEELTK